MIIIDVHGAFIRHCHGILSNPANLTLHNLRSCIFSDILAWRKKHYAEYGEIVLAYDNTSGQGASYWRREIFKEYKANRAKARNVSLFNWTLFFTYFDQVKAELAEHFPYKVLSIPKCEADELIYLELENRPENERSLIISADKDLKQCQRLENVRQWSYMTNKYLDEKHPLLYILEHTIRGDTGDGVPNVLSPNDVFINPTIKQKSIRSADVERWVTMPLNLIHEELALKLVIKPTKKRPLEITFDEALKTIKSNWQRNVSMVDLSKTPQKYVDLYLDVPEVKNVATINAQLYSFFVKSGLTLFVHEVSDFINNGEKKVVSFAELMAAKRAKLLK